MTVAEKPRIEAYVGASGSGKGVSLDRRLRELKPRRLLIWDPRDEYARHAARVTSLGELLSAVRKAGAGPFRVRYVPGAGVPLARAFGLVCEVAFALGDLVFLAEELSDVTTASHAPAAWRQVITQGRHKRLHVMGAAQRPALIDKTFLGNCTLIRCFTLRYAEDRRTMAKALDVPEARITALATVETPAGVTINFTERDFRAGVLRDGHIKLARRA